MAGKNLSWGGFSIRLIAALALVFGTYNPSGKSFFHWFKDNPNVFSPEIAIVGLILLIGWAVYLRATMRSLGVAGVILAGAFFASLIWLMLDKGVVELASTKTMIYLGEVALCALLATGVSWSHLRRRITGQIDVDEADI